MKVLQRFFSPGLIVGEILQETGRILGEFGFRGLSVYLHYHIENAA